MSGTIRRASLADSPNFSPAFLAAVAPPFVPEEVKLGTYTFVPWVRTGLAAALKPPSGAELRARVTVGAVLQDERGGTAPVEKTLTLRGPGDVLGLDGSQIIRRVPEAGTMEAEESFLVHVEFDRPELPWLFTPFAPDDARFRPWLALVVCDADAARLEPGLPGLPLRLRTRLSELQSLDDAAAWAHAQVVGGMAGVPGVADRLSDAHAAVNLSRLLCPRRLHPRRDWVAAVVPSFDCGMRAGLGLPGGTLGPAWERGDGEGEVVLPAYHAWRFSTGAEGDFESLARRLHGIAAPWAIGRRVLDASRPEGGLPDLGEAEPGRLQVLRCALVSPAPPPPDAPAEDAGWDLAARARLRARVDSTADDPAHADLPRVGPRLYARFQHGQAALGTLPDNPDADWFTQLNTSPAHRVVAGLGTRVVRRDQEMLMQAAWAQVGEVRKANSVLSRLQFARFVGQSLHRRHLDRLGVDELAQVMRGVQGKVRLGGSALTVHGTVAASAMPDGALTAAFRRMARPRGALARLAGPQAALRGVVAAGEAFRDLRRSYREPDGLHGFSTRALAAMPAAGLMQVFGTDEATARATATQSLAVVEGRVPVADRLMAPVAQWRVPEGTIDLGSRMADRLSTIVETVLPEAGTADAARMDALSPLLAGIATSEVGAVSSRATERMEALDRAFPAVGAGAAGPLVRDPVVVGPAIRDRVREGLQGGIGGAVRGGIASGQFEAGVTGRRAAEAIAGRGASALRRGDPAGGIELRRDPTGGIDITRRGPGDEVEVRRRDPADGIDVTGRVPTAEAELTRRGPGTTEATGIAARQRFETGMSRSVATGLATAQGLSFARLATELSDLVRGIGAAATVLPRTPGRPALQLGRRELLAAIEPHRTVTARAVARLTRHPEWLPGNWFADGLVTPVMAAPRFDRPMYEALDAYDRDWLVPGLGTVAETDFVTVLATNPAFTEAFLVGLSDEMGRELLWRDYPTDQRGTYFRRFWDEARDELETGIHRFRLRQGPLGSHVRGATAGGAGLIVLAIRGELVRRHPDIMVLALHAVDPAERPPRFAAPPAEGTGRVMFHARLPPDILLVGFELTEAALRAEADRWWFVLAEHPTAPRFGLDLDADGAGGAVWRPRSRNTNDLRWSGFGVPHGGFLAGAAVAPQAGAVAQRLLQSPVRAAFHAVRLLAPALQPPG